MNSTKEAIDKRIEELFEGFPGSIDWADDKARFIAMCALDTLESSIGIEKFFGKKSRRDEQHLAWAMFVAIAPTIRGMRSDALNEANAKIDARVKSERKRIVKESRAPTYLSQFIRDAASNLDGRGLAPEANALRDAANILEEEF